MMVFTGDKPGWYIRREDPIWSWVGSPYVSLEKEKMLSVLGKLKRKCSYVVRIFNLAQDCCRDWKDREYFEWFAEDKMYVLPNYLDMFISDLHELSLTHNIVGMATTNNYRYLEMAFVESNDHSSNIDSDILDCIVGKVKGRKHETSG